MRILYKLTARNFLLLTELWTARSVTGQGLEERTQFSGTFSMKIRIVHPIQMAPQTFALKKKRLLHETEHESSASARTTLDFNFPARPNNKTGSTMS